MLATLSALVLMSAGLIGVPQPPTQPCSFIVGGFLNEPLSPGEAIEQARRSIWNVYSEHVEACIDLRIFARPGVVTDIVFRSHQHDGLWRAAILNTPNSTRMEQEIGSTRFKDVECIERVKPSSGTRFRDNAPHKASEYNLIIYLKDGSTLEL
jgi:hypothetical protein